MRSNKTALETIHILQPEVITTQLLKEDITHQYHPEATIAAACQEDHHLTQAEAAAEAWVAEDPAAAAEVVVWAAEDPEEAVVAEDDKPPQINARTNTSTQIF